ARNRRFDGLNYYIDKISQSIFDGKLIFAGSQSDDYFNYMAIGNGLLLLSREESFSLVTIEAAYLGIPTVGFNVGIAKLFIKEGMGEIVEEGDLAGLKRSMNKCEHQHFEKSFLRSQALEFGIENQVLKFQKLLDSI
ncbi:MAG: glycosyltransferase, partial [Pedobacter sp.]